MEQLKFSRKKLRVLAFIGIAAIISSFSTISVSYLLVDHKSYPIILGIFTATGLFSCGLAVWVVLYSKKTQDTFDIDFRQSRERYKSIIAASTTGAWEYHSDSEYQWCSPEYFEMLGYNEDVFLSNGELSKNNVWANLLHPDDKETATKKFKDYLTNGSPGIYQNYFRLKHKDGTWLWIWSRGQTLKNPDGTLTNITLGTHIDITEKENLEIELLRHNKKLLKYAYLNAHEVRGPVARLLGLIQVSKLDTDPDYPWFFEKVENEATSIDKVLKVITEELNEIEEHKRGQ